MRAFENSARRTYHLKGECDADRGIFKPLEWFRDLDDRHGYATVVRSATCRACLPKIEKALQSGGHSAVE